MQRIPMNYKPKKTPHIIYYDIEPDMKIIQEIVGGYFTIIPLKNYEN